MEGRGFYVSYNNVDGDIYGCATTALVRGQMERFLILNGDHRAAYAPLVPLGFDACLEYFEAHPALANKRSDALPEPPSAPPSPLLQAIKIAECAWGQRNTGTRKVMVARTGGLNEGRTRRHVKLSSDAGGLYVRLGKHGA